MEISALNKTPSQNLDSFERDNDLGYSWLFFRTKPSVFEDPLPPGEQVNRIAFLAVFLKLPAQNSHGLLVKPDNEDVAPDVLQEADEVPQGVLLLDALHPVHSLHENCGAEQERTTLPGIKMNFE